jgi:hypothetical protein
MADAQIATILIPCLVIQFNNQQFIETTEAGIQVIGQTLDVPCRNSIPSDIGYWAVPVKDAGIFTRLQFMLMRENNSVTIQQPTFDSFPVFTVNDKMNNNTWWIYGTKDQFLNSCNTCCGAGTVPMPGIDGAFLPLIAPCQQFCNVPATSGGALQAYFGIPNVYGGSDTFFPYGSYNNVAFSAASGSGYATVTLLLAFLNANWTQTGTITWTATPDGLTLIATGGALNDSICIVVARIGPSS